MKLIYYLFLCFFIICFLFVGNARAQRTHGGPATSYKEAEIIEVRENSNVIQNIIGLRSQTIVVSIRSSQGKTEKVLIENSQLPNALADTLQKGDKVIVAQTVDQNGALQTYVADYNRFPQLLILVAIFVVIIFGVGRWQGLASFFGMILSFFIIVRFTIPQILGGTNPVLAALLTSMIIIPVTFYLSHGINRKTNVAIVGTFISLALTGFLATFFVGYTRLTGFAAEEAGFLQTLTGGTVNIKNLLLAGIMIGAMGILDDITISQTSLVERLRAANPKYTFSELYHHSMVVGRDHIASLVNTLVLVYAGASLPLFVLFVNQNLALKPVISHEIVATEIVRTIVSSIGIVMAVPITTLIACHFASKDKSPKKTSF